jgi:hypothetical protein
MNPTFFQYAVYSDNLMAVNINYYYPTTWSKVCVGDVWLFFVHIHDRHQHSPLSSNHAFSLFSLAWKTVGGSFPNDIKVVYFNVIVNSLNFLVLKTCIDSLCHIKRYRSNCRSGPYTEVKPFQNWVQYFLPLQFIGLSVISTDKGLENVTFNCLDICPY